MKKLIVLFYAILLFSNCTHSKSQTVAHALCGDSYVIGQKIDSLMAAYSFYGRFSGTVLVGNNDEVWFHNSFGFADTEKEKPNTNQSVYGIGSITKTFTATAVLKLVSENKLKLTDQLSKFYPGLGPIGNEITIHHLLSMSSGIHQDFSRSKTYDIESIVFPEDYPIDLDSLAHYFGELTSDFKPGKQFDYSNMNYILLAGIVEKASGVDYRTYLKNTLLTSIGMNTIDFGSENSDAHLVSKPYIGLPGYHKIPEYWHDSWVVGAGGIFASAQDLYSWMKKMNNNEVLDSASTRQLFTKYQKENHDHYGYGWQIGQRRGHQYIYHGGGTLGYLGEVGFFPELGVYVVVLTNHTHGLKEIGKTAQLNKEINRQIHNILFGQPANILPLTKAESQPFIEGVYNVGSYAFDFTRKSDVLTITPHNDGPSILDVAFLQDLTEEGKRFNRIQRLAQAFGEEDFKYVRSKSELMLKLLVSHEKLAQIWTEITGDKGALISCNFYQVPNEQYSSTYKVRLVHQKKEVGLLLTFNRFGKMKGMHIDQSFSFGGPKTVEAISINDKLLFIDGFKYGYPDASIEWIDGRWIVKTVAGELNLE